jgi:TolA-binding protein
VGEAAADYLIAFREMRRAGAIDRVARLYGEMRRYGVGTNLGEAALLRLAFEFQRVGESTAAAEAFDEVASRFPVGPQAEMAMVRRAEILWSDLGRIEDALHAYERVLQSHPGGEWRQFAEARVRSMRAMTGAGAELSSTTDSRSFPAPFATRPRTSS